MSLELAILTGLAMGIAFGFALEKSRVFEPGVIVGQMQLRNFLMLKIFLTAVATGAVVLAALNGFGLVKLQPKAAAYAADAVGGLVLGVGIAMAGACPGTTLAQIGAGYRDAIFTLVGGLFGAVAYSYAQPVLSGTFLGQSGSKLVLSDMIGIPYWQGALALAAIIVVVLVALERMTSWRREVGVDVDGDLAPSHRRHGAGPRAAAAAE
ncbi:MAG: YeeE/YedE family protein [Pseudorhodoplanes sp.]|nr:YeeE/YedE family protein [Pseudorhodoplanes sp.]